MNRPDSYIPDEWIAHLETIWALNVIKSSPPLNNNTIMTSYPPSPGLVFWELSHRHKGIGKQFSHSGEDLRRVHRCRGPGNPVLSIHWNDNPCSGYESSILPDALHLSRFTIPLSFELFVTCAFEIYIKSWKADDIFNLQTVGSHISRWKISVFVRESSLYLVGHRTQNTNNETYSS